MAVRGKSAIDSTKLAVGFALFTRMHVDLLGKEQVIRRREAMVLVLVIMYYL